MHLVRGKASKQWRDVGLQFVEFAPFGAQWDVDYRAEFQKCLVQRLRTHFSEWKVSAATFVPLMKPAGNRGNSMVSISTKRIGSVFYVSFRLSRTTLANIGNLFEMKSVCFVDEINWCGIYLLYNTWNVGCRIVSETSCTEIGKSLFKMKSVKTTIVSWKDISEWFKINEAIHNANKFIYIAIPEH